MKSQASKIMSFSKDLTFSRYNLFSSFNIGNTVALHLPWRLPRGGKKKVSTWEYHKIPNCQQETGRAGSWQSTI